MRESEVEARFAQHLSRTGWTVTLNDPSFADVIAEHPQHGRLVAEVKGSTSSPGLDIDTMFGQLLRRMGEPADDIRYAAVVPESLSAAVRRVPKDVLDKLNVDVWLVPEVGDPYRL